MSPYIHETLARERQNMLLAEAAADRIARQARARRHQHGAPAARRSLPHRALAWLPSAWGRALIRRPEPASVAGGTDA
jgi:hypothetical protein